MIKIALFLGRICEYGQIGLKTSPFSFEMFSYAKNAYSLLGSLKGLPQIGPRIEALTFTSPGLNLRSRSRILHVTSILKCDLTSLNCVETFSC